MKKWICLFLLLPAIAFAEEICEECEGEMYAWGVQEQSWSTPAAGSCDADLVAHWEFADGALTVDSCGTNTLTNTTSVVYASGGADFENDDDDYMTITNANMDAGFPFKSGVSEDDFTVIIQATTETLEAYMNFFFVGVDSATNASIGIRVDGSKKVHVLYGTISGAGSGYSVTSSFDTALSNSTKYQISYAYDASENSGEMRIYDYGAADLLDTNKTMGHGEMFWIDDGTMLIGDTPYPGMVSFDGVIHDFKIYTTLLSDAEIDALR